MPRFNDWRDKLDSLIVTCNSCGERSLRTATQCTLCNEPLTEGEADD